MVYISGNLWESLIDFEVLEHLVKSTSTFKKKNVVLAVSWDDNAVSNSVTKFLFY